MNQVKTTAIFLGEAPERTSQLQTLKSLLSQKTTLPFRILAVVTEASKEALVSECQGAEIDWLVLGEDTLSTQLEKALNQVNTEYSFVLAAGSHLHTDHLEHLMSFAHKNPEQALVSSRGFLFSEDHPRAQLEPGADTITINGSIENLLQALDPSHVVRGGIIYKTELLKKLLPKHPVGLLLEWQLVLNAIKLGYKVETNNRATVINWPLIPDYNAPDVQYCDNPLVRERAKILFDSFEETYPVTVGSLCRDSTVLSLTEKRKIYFYGFEAGRHDQQKQWDKTWPFMLLCAIERRPKLNAFVERLVSFLVEWGRTLKSLKKRSA